LIEIIKGDFMGAGAFFFQGGAVLVTEEGPVAVKNLEIPLAYTEYFPLSDVFTIPAIIGGAQEGETIHGVFVPPEAPLPPHWQAIPVRQILSLLADDPIDGTGQAGLLLRAFHLAQWRRESLFCGSCGSKNTDAIFDAAVSDNAVADSAAVCGTARLCPSCGRMEFPRIAPAVMVLITNDEGKILLAHNKTFAPGLYSLIAGFVEAGENLEAAAAREVREEVGIEIRGIQYAASQPWPFPHSLTICFTARYASGAIKPDGIEIEDAQWFSRDNLPKLPSPGSAALRLIQRWLEGG
jgi:NAD+ diphosphatase